MVDCSLLPKISWILVLSALSLLILLSGIRMAGVSMSSQTLDTATRKGAATLSEILGNSVIVLSAAVLLVTTALKLPYSSTFAVTSFGVIIVVFFTASTTVAFPFMWFEDVSNVALTSCLNNSSNVWNSPDATEIAGAVFSYISFGVTPIVVISIFALVPIAFCFMADEVEDDERNLETKIGNRFTNSKNPKRFFVIVFVLSYIFFSTMSVGKFLSFFMMDGWKFMEMNAVIICAIVEGSILFTTILCCLPSVMIPLKVPDCDPALACAHLLLFGCGGFLYISLIASSVTTTVFSVLKIMAQLYDESQLACNEGVLTNTNPLSQIQKSGLCLFFFSSIGIFIGFSALCFTLVLSTPYSTKKMFKAKPVVVTANEEEP